MEIREIEKFIKVLTMNTQHQMEMDQNRKLMNQLNQAIQMIWIIYLMNLSNHRNLQLTEVNLIIKII